MSKKKWPEIESSYVYMYAEEESNAVLRMILYVLKYITGDFSTAVLFVTMPLGHIS